MFEIVGQDFNAHKLYNAAVYAFMFSGGDTRLHANAKVYMSRFALLAMIIMYIVGTLTPNIRVI